MTSIEQEIKLLRGNIEKNLIGEIVTDVTPDMIKGVLNERNNDIMVFAQIKEEVEVGTIGGGFRFSEDMSVLKDKLLHINGCIERDRSEEDAKRGGRKGKVFGFRGDIIVDGVKKEHPRVIDDEFITNIQIISFVMPPFSERINAISENLIKIANDSKRDIDDLKYKFDEEQKKAIEFREKLTRTLNNVKKYGTQLEDLVKRTKDKSFISELEMLITHKNFVDLEIVNDDLVFTTNHIDIYDPSNMENVFKGNKFKITVKLSSSRIKFEGLDRTRSHKSYWSTNDPHPHVNGRTGEACLGNVSSTLADLCSSNEIYALFTMLVNFLQTFNIDDSAGKYIRNWEMVDGSDNPYSTSVRCKQCGDEINLDEDDYRRCGDCDGYLCENCGEWHGENDTYYCDEHYAQHIFTCLECDEESEDMRNKRICSACGKVMCDNCVEYHDDKPYCPSCMPSEEVDEEVDNGTDEEGVQQEVVVAGSKCDDCGKILDMGESISWVENTGILLELCEGCMKTREERL
ncbi:hypothetical protein [Romboutsia sp.]|uniref:hypothetical protein n=1 Tax=Romboutsia sp. TaxID=1965302 RepID=UPI002B53FF27|nr:hypothetical protein [Romboutsia sp.]HSQ90202.1 hypothetical protein [Romboutsia sp.]